MEIFLDTETGLPEWAAVELASASRPGYFTLGQREGRFIPIIGLAEAGDERRSRWPLEVVEASPVDLGGSDLTRLEEDQLAAHYGLEYPTHWINNGVPGGAVVIGVAGLAAASEELAASTVY